MTFRQINEKYIVPGAQTLMILGIVALCQPWNLFFHRYGLTIILVGLVGFIVFSHFEPEPEAEDDGDAFDDAMETLTLNAEPDNDPTGKHGGHANG